MYNINSIYLFVNMRAAGKNFWFPAIASGTYKFTSVRPYVRTYVRTLLRDLRIRS